MNRREFLRRALGASSLLMAGAIGRSAIRTGDACRAAERFLASQQSEDGAWRSTQYGAFREGDALTPLILWSLAGLDSPAVKQGRRWLENLTDQKIKDAEPWKDLAYPLFTASYAGQIFRGAEDEIRATCWSNVADRLHESNGPWSDTSVPLLARQKEETVPDMLAPNLSATLLGLRALMPARYGWGTFSAGGWATTCQNFSVMAPSGFDDGGFFFTPNDPIRNKAGAAGTDSSGKERYRSYGSATCDALLIGEFLPHPKDDPRRLAAIQWLRRHCDGLTHAGDWPPDRAAARDSLTYYYAQAFADVLAYLPGDAWAERQRRKLVSDLLERQASDGSWQGEASASCEDDSLLATAFALHALRVCA